VRGGIEVLCKAAGGAGGERFGLPDQQRYDHGQRHRQCGRDWSGHRDGQRRRGRSPGSRSGDDGARHNVRDRHDPVLRRQALAEHIARESRHTGEARLALERADAAVVAGQHERPDVAGRDDLAVDFDPAPMVDPESEAIYAVNSAATLYFQSALRGTAGTSALAYLRKRGLVDATIERFALGFAPDGWDHLLRYLGQRGHAPGEIASAGLATKRDDGGHYDRFRDPIIFPIRDAKARVLGFGGRGMGDAQPKYLNSPQTRVFDKGSVFYCQDVAAEHIRKGGRVVIVEGYMDALVAHQAGFGDVVASMGTSLTEKQVRTLNKSGRTVVLALDPDAAGFRAVERTIQLAYRTAQRELSPALTTRVPTERVAGRFTGSAHVRFQVVAVPDGKDPDELILSDPEAWRRLIDGALPIVDYYVKQVAATLTDSLDFKRDAAARLVPILAELSDPLERDHYVSELARMLDVGEQTVAGLVAQQRQSAAATVRLPDAATPAEPAAAGGGRAHDPPAAGVAVPGPGEPARPQGARAAGPGGGRAGQPDAGSPDRLMPHGEGVLPPQRYREEGLLVPAGGGPGTDVRTP